MGTQSKAASIARGVPIFVVLADVGIDDRDPVSGGRKVAGEKPAVGGLAGIPAAADGSPADATAVPTKG